MHVKPMPCLPRFLLILNIIQIVTFNSVRPIAQYESLSSLIEPISPRRARLSGRSSAQSYAHHPLSSAPLSRAPQPSILVSRFIMNLRQAGTPAATFSTPDSSALPSAPAFVVPPSYIGAIGGDLDHDVSLVFAAGDGDYYDGSFELRTSAEAEAEEELGVGGDAPLQTAQVEPLGLGGGDA